MGKYKAIPTKMTGQEDEKLVRTNRHQAMQLQLHSKPEYALLDDGAIIFVISAILVENLKLEVAPAYSSFFGANGTNNAVIGKVNNAPVSFGKIVMSLNLLVKVSTPIERIMRHPTRIRMHMKIDKYRSRVKMPKKTLQQKQLI